MIAPVLGRIIVVLTSFALSVFIAFSVMVALAYSYWQKSIESYPQPTLSHYFDATPIIYFILTTPITLLPALVAILVGELAHIRSMLYYIVAGGAAAVVMPLIMAAPDGPGGSYTATYFSIIATAGFSGGLIYWLTAGRRA